MTQYQRGALAERWAKQELIDCGFHTVVRAAGSRGVFDLVAIGENAIKLVQVKRVQSGPMPSFSEDLAVMREVQVPECCSRELWIWHDEHKRWVICPV